MMRSTLAGALIAVTVLTGVTFAQAPKAAAKPNFSGTWVYDDASTKALAQEAQVMAGALFTLQFTAVQNDKTYTMNVDIGSAIVTAIYNLDGSPSKNMSPPSVANQPPIEVTSTAKWDGAALVIASQSFSPSANGPVEVKSVRKMWLDEHGRLIIDRTGTPAGMVTPSRSVYTKKP